MFLHIQAQADSSIGLQAGSALSIKGAVDVTFAVRHGSNCPRPGLHLKITASPRNWRTFVAKRGLEQGKLATGCQIFLYIDDRCWR